MSDHATHSSADYDIRVAEDQLTATVRLEAGGLIDATHLVEQLTRTGIKFIDHAAIASAVEEAKRISDAMKAPDHATDASIGQGFTVIVARGKPAVQDVPETLKRIEPTTPTEAPENHYERVQIVTVNPQDAIATISPPVIGHDGVDVFGRPIPRRRVALPIAPGEGALRDGDLMRAERAGRVRIDGSRIRVEQQLDIPGDVNFATGNIRFDGDVTIRRSVYDLFVVSSTADVHVGGAIEAAHVHAGGHLTVAGGIAGKDKGHCTADGNIAARYVSNAHVDAGETVTIHGEIANSRIICGANLLVETGPILASHVTANGGVECRTIGNPAFVKTVIEVGTDLKLKELATALLPKLNRCVSECQHVKHFAQALMRDPKRLTVQQREEATNLLYRIGQTDSDLATKLEEFRVACRHSQERCKAEVIVHDCLYPGVVFRLPGLMATVRDAFRGPLKVSLTTIDKRATITITNLESGTVIPLITYKAARCDTNDVRAILQIAA